MIRKLFKALLSKQVWEQYSYKITEDFFPDELKGLFRTLNYAHDKYEDDLSVEELVAIHFAVNPTLTASAKLVINEVASTLEDETIDYNEAAVKDIINAAWKQELCHRVMEHACLIAEGKEDDWGKITDYVNQASYDLTDSKDYDVLTLEDLTNIDDDVIGERWKFNLPRLQEATSGLPKSSFGIVAARPEVGKTGFWVSLTCSDGGFVHQGARVHIWRNEETYTMVARRLLASLLGVPFEKAHEHIDEYRDMLRNLTGDVALLKDEVTAGGDIKDIEEYIINNEGNIDILIIDQIDNVTVNRASATDDHAALGKLYSKARELANKYSIAIMGVTQAGAEAEGKRYYGYNELYGSKTNKAATGDYVFCIGADARQEGQEDNGLRYLNFAKNKLKGPHAAITYLLDHKLSRMKH